MILIFFLDLFIINFQFFLFLFFFLSSLADYVKGIVSSVPENESGKVLQCLLSLV